MSGELQKTSVIKDDLKKRMLGYAKNVLKLNVSSVALPDNYSWSFKNQENVLDWLNNKIKPNIKNY